MATGSRSDPLIGFNFYVEIDGVVKAQFKSCEGLDSESETVEYNETTKNGVVVIKKLPGRIKWSDITLSRGITDVMELWDWRKKVEEGKISEARANGSIVLYSQAHEEVARWNFVEGWPRKISGPKLVADGNDIAIEELVISHEGLSRVKS